MSSWHKELDILYDKLELKGWRLRDKKWRMFSGKLYKIQDKEGKTVPFIPTDIQEMMYEEFSGRLIVLKARQIMCTTLVMISFLDDCLFEDNMEARTIADDEGTIEKLFKRVQFAYDQLPDFLKVCFPQVASNKYEMKIGNRNSHYQVCLGTHGDTVRRLHFSEVAFIPKQHVPKRVSESLETVPQGIGNTFIVMESIANGGDGLFAETYNQAKNSKNEWKCVFFAWFMHYEYKEAIDDEKKKLIESTLDEREKKIIKKYKLSLEQIAWRRTKIGSMMGATYEERLELFLVKYPENDKDCFLLTGMQVFSPSLIDIYNENKDTCHLKPISVYGFNMLDVFVENAMGEVLIYNKPEKGVRYILGADVSDGTSRGDRSKAFVLEVGTSRVMAFYNARNTKPETFGSRCATLGVLYNNAELAIESNFRDSCVKEVIRRRYPNVYYHGKEEGKRLKSWGWNTNERSKRLMIDQFKYDFESRIWDALPAELLEEMEHYIEMPNGRTEAGAGYFDDCVSSFAIANYLALKFPSFKGRENEKKEKGYCEILNKQEKMSYHSKKKGVHAFNVSGGI